MGVCVRCGEKGEGVRKCKSRGCGLEVGVCRGCEEREGEVVCCADCREMDTRFKEGDGSGKRPMCLCEKDREARLWGSDGDVENRKAQRTQGWKTKRRKALDWGISEKEKANIVVQLMQPEVV